MVLDFRRFFRASNPSRNLDLSQFDDQKYYVDFSAVRGTNLIKELGRTIVFSEDEPTCQLFTGHIGCGKSTELSRLKAELEQKGFHVVYFESSQDLDMADVDISDILLAIARQVSQSLEAAQIKLQPNRFLNLLQGTVNLLNSEVTGLKAKVPVVGDIGINAEGGKFSLAVGIGEITTKAKDSKDIRSLLRQHLEPRVNNILEAINHELIEPAQKQFKQQGKAGLVVIIDNLDRIDNRLRPSGRTQPEYLFVDRGEQLNKLKCHVIYTVPLVLAFSNDKENLTNRFGSDPQLLPMVRVQERDGSPCVEGIALLQQMIMARAFPDLEPDQRLSLILEVFDAPETLERLCKVSGGHVRNVLVLLNSCLKKDDPPLTRDLVEQVISQRRSELSKAVTPEEWKLLRQVAQQKTVRGEEEYQTLLRSLFVFEYRDAKESWFDINPILAEAREL
ncbi:P-loop NTPase fold protein [Floridanema evergladense]|uniref:P-loop NTPase fold protein n=1 Tax=Floridaenema evergladense BLCC-F167 TaxID=3153639 RepID=A0ABV4WRR8_9CYAN